LLQQPLKRRKFFLPGKGFNVPGKDNRVVALPVEAGDSAIEDNSDFPERQAPELRRLQPAFDPGPQKV
jgi:hypothetical protein